MMTEFTVEFVKSEGNQLMTESTVEFVKAEIERLEAKHKAEVDTHLMIKKLRNLQELDKLPIEKRISHYFKDKF